MFDPADGSVFSCEAESVIFGFDFGFGFGFGGASGVAAGSDGEAAVGAVVAGTAVVSAAPGLSVTTGAGIGGGGFSSRRYGQPVGDCTRGRREPRRPRL